VLLATAASLVVGRLVKVPAKVTPGALAALSGQAT
jgi:hypothetical protein